MVNYTDNKMTIECDCGTHLVRVEKLDKNEYYVSIFEDTFYSKQNKGIWKKIKYKAKYIWHILVGKEYRLEQLCLTDKDMEELTRSIILLRSLDSDNYCAMDEEDNT